YIPRPPPNSLGIEPCYGDALSIFLPSKVSCAKFSPMKSLIHHWLASAGIACALFPVSVCAFAHTTATSASDYPNLERSLVALGQKTGGKIGVALTHIESGRSANLNADEPLPLFSVVKLPLSVVVLRKVETGGISLDQPLTITADEISS